MQGKTYSLKKEYSAGSQMWFSTETKLDNNIRKCSCGVIALHDLAQYKGYIKTPKGRDEYKEQIRKMKRGGMFIVPARSG